MFANTSLMHSKKLKIGNGIGNFPELIPRNDESVTFGQFLEGGGRTLTGPSVTVTSMNSKQYKIGNGIGYFPINSEK